MRPSVELGTRKGSENRQAYVPLPTHVDAPFTQVTFNGVPMDLRISAYIDDHAYTKGDFYPDFITQQAGVYQSVSASIYSLVPDLNLYYDFSRGTFSNPSPLVRKPYGTMREERIGHVDASYYPADQVAKLSVPSLYEGYKQVDALLEDPNMPTLLKGAEHFLLRRYPNLQVIATAIEPRSWTEVINKGSAFYLQQGYKTQDGTWYLKEVTPEEREAASVPGIESEIVTLPRPPKEVVKERRDAIQGMVNQAGLLVAGLILLPEDQLQEVREKIRRGL